MVILQTVLSLKQKCSKSQHHTQQHHTQHSNKFISTISCNVTKIDPRIVKQLSQKELSEFITLKNKLCTNPIGQANLEKLDNILLNNPNATYEHGKDLIYTMITVNKVKTYFEENQPNEYQIFVNKLKTKNFTDAFNYFNEQFIIKFHNVKSKLLFVIG